MAVGLPKSIWLNATDSRRLLYAPVFDQGAHLRRARVQYPRVSGNLHRLVDHAHPELNIDS